MSGVIESNFLLFSMQKTNVRLLRLQRTRSDTVEAKYNAVLNQPESKVISMYTTFFYSWQLAIDTREPVLG